MSDEKKIGYRCPPKEFQFKKGNNANPLGAGAHNPELRAIKRLTASEVAEIGSLIIAKNQTKLKAIIRDADENPDSKHSALKVWISKVAVKGIRNGDAHALDVLLNRLIGRTTEKIQLTGEGGGPVRALVGAMTPEERQKALEKIRAERDEAGED